jgi:hypothetical protein
LRNTYKDTNEEKKIKKADEFGNKITTVQSESSKSSDEEYEDTESYDNEESDFDSQASRINFWKDINTADDEYTNAVIVSKE